MRIKKATLIRQRDVSSWTSCQTITQNLYDLYAGLAEIQIQNTLELSDSDPFSTFEKGYELSQLESDLLVFIDHFPCPATIIKSFSKYITSKKRPDIIIHIFGDFTLQAAEWLSAEEQLKEFNIKFICASDAQANLLNKLLNNPKNIESHFFPLRDGAHHFSQEMRESTRERLKIHENELVFIYTGRLSMQKNVIELISMMNELKRTFQLKFKLLVAGPFDDLGIPYIGQYSQEGAYCTRWMKQVPNVDFVHYLGSLDSNELHQYYCASDCFISLSTHNDEDFGMSPCEAGATGLPLILTNWGGYSSFKKYFSKTYLVETTFNSTNSSRPSPDKKSLFKTVINFIENFSPKERKQIEECSLNIMRKNLKNSIIELETSPFNGFTELMTKVGARFSATKNSPFSGVRGNYSDLYYDLYDSYIEVEKKDV
ncbi:glycosyltransferase family 4 protein [Halobacteriovorax sp. JY17]|uniref:glycosyltransferase family 4 protein n=1 Tax=Halobacteriovorax sp. JY17 TaxID=2014617 RepID=UPI000C4583C4|nr:glycosyltransferase family 4 protein [Halobacteriovorax sp. JY17]PIK14025.1 MAG: hypothetical protein CES88_13660 [Halobacteriovorax sp. JY17]